MIDTNTQTLVIIRGIPGSGKSTFAKKLIAEYEADGYTAEMFEADDFWLDADGNYVFNPKLLPKAHSECLRRTFDSADRGTDYVIVSNTFTSEWELRPYLDEAKERGMDVTVYRMRNEFRNIHDVPPEAIQRMKNRFVDYAGEINVSAKVR